MKCPGCDSELRTIKYEGVEIEECPECGGHWLDAGELATVVRTVEEEFSPEVKDSLDTLSRKTVTEREAESADRTCPKCSPPTNLQRSVYAVTSGIVLDKCPVCGGLWLDKDELEQVQVVVEEWLEKVRRDKERFAPFLEKIDAQKKSQSAGGLFSLGFVSAVLRRLV